MEGVVSSAVQQTKHTAGVLLQSYEERLDRANAAYIIQVQFRKRRARQSLQQLHRAHVRMSKQGALQFAVNVAGTNLDERLENLKTSFEETTAASTIQYFFRKMLSDRTSTKLVRVQADLMEAQRKATVLNAAVAIQSSFRNHRAQVGLKRLHAAHAKILKAAKARAQPSQVLPLPCPWACR